ncbi:MAG: NADH-quinone oxidoreductase subunit K [Myxococcota bacterium]
MAAGVDLALVLLVLTSLVLLGSSRIDAYIRIAAAQGALVGLLTVGLHTGDLAPRAAALAVISLVVKAGILPWLLRRAMREAHVRREVEPYVGYALSVLAGVLALGFAVWLGARLPMPRPAASPLIVPVALFLFLVGLFLIVSRRKALTQVLGYLVLENGIFVFGAAFALEEPMIVELGVLLDALVAVFVMGITISHINREFDSIDTAHLSELREWNP